MAGERVASSGRNLRTALVGQVLIFTVNLISRRIFIRMLGSEYVGLSGLFGHLLVFLSLLEPGFDAACIFALYKPLAFGDKIMTAQICTYLKRIYRIVSALSLVFGILVTPIALFLSGSGVDNGTVTFIWILSVLDMSLTFLFSHRRILPFADQNAYIITTYGYIFFIIGQAARFFALVKFGSFLSYFLAGAISGLIEEILLFFHIKRIYPYINSAPYPIPDGEKTEIKRQVKALFFHKIGGIVCGSVDNLAVFMFLGLSSGALYSNYTMLSGTLLAFVSIVCGSVGASVGNLAAVSDKKRMERVFSTSFFGIFTAGGFLAAALFFTYPDIMRLWMGESMVLGTLETALFSVCMFVSSLRRPLGIFLDGCGLFEREKYKAIIEAVIVLAATLTLAPRFGICGVLLGQISGSAFFSFPFESFLLYKYGFKREYSKFFSEFIRYFISLVLAVFISGVLCNFVSTESFLGIALKILFCFFSFGAVFGILFFDSTRLRDAIFYARRMLGRA